MYPQAGLARTMSVATTSTVPAPDRSSYAGPSAPAHPYGIYPQNTVPESSDATAVPPIPVGFPGFRGSVAQRRLGPEGEEVGGIIGRDGYSEELPPYTQYPDEAFATKQRPNVAIPAVAGAAIPTSIAAAIPAAVAGAGGIGLATRNPEFESRENLANYSISPQSRHSTGMGSVMSDANSHHSSANIAAFESEKPPMKKWQIIARRKICGVIPIWALVLVGAALVFFGIVLGSVLAVLKATHPGGPSQQQKQHHDNDPVA